MIVRFRHAGLRRLFEKGDGRRVSSTLMPKVERVLARSFQALMPGGSIAIHDTHINACKTGPLEVAEYSVLLMYSTEGKCYSVSEMDALLAGAGFVAVEYTPMRSHRSLITARKRRSG